MWRVYDEAIDWFRLENEEYVQATPSEEGFIESRVFPGLRLAVDAMLRDDLPRALAVLQTGLESEAHKAFVARLAGTSTSPEPSA